MLHRKMWVLTFELGKLDREDYGAWVEVNKVVKEGVWVSDRLSIASQLR